MEVAETPQEARRFTVVDEELAAPFVPSPLPIVQRMLELARVGPGDKLFDLGSGDGRTVIMAAEKFGAEAVGVELDDRLFQQSASRIARLSLHRRARIVHGSMFQTDLRGATVVTLYQLTGVNQRLRPILERQLRAGTRVVSHDFPIPGWKHTKLVTGVLEDGSPHAIYLYVVERLKEEAMATTADKRGYTRGKYGIELDGVMSGFMDEVEGGDATADVVVEKVGSDHIVHKHIAGVKYEDIGVSEEPLLTELRSRIRDVRVGPDGAVYVLTDSGTATVSPQHAADQQAPEIDAEVGGVTGSGHRVVLERVLPGKLTLHFGPGAPDWDPTRTGTWARWHLLTLLTTRAKSFETSFRLAT